MQFSSTYFTKRAVQTVGVIFKTKAKCSSINWAKLEWFSLDCRKVNWFCRVMLHDWLTNQKRGKTSVRSHDWFPSHSQSWFAHIRFQRFSPASCVTSIYRFIPWSVSFVIGLNDFFGFVFFMIFNWKKLFVVREVFSWTLKSNWLFGIMHNFNSYSGITSVEHILRMSPTYLLPKASLHILEAIEKFWFDGWTVGRFDPSLALRNSQSGILLYGQSSQSAAVLKEKLGPFPYVLPSGNFCQVS